MEGNSCSSNCFDTVNIKNEPEYGFNEQVHVKEEVVECLKEEAAWEDSTAEDEAATLARLYAGHEVKDELVLGPEGLQPRDMAFTLYACQALAARAQPVLRDCVSQPERSADARRPERHVANNADVGNEEHSNANIHTKKETYICDICKKRFALKTKLMEHFMIHVHQSTEQEEINVADDNARAPNTREHPALRDCVVRLERLEHIDINTEEETYICDTCKKWFPLKTQLVDHVMIHIHRSAERQESRRVAGNARGGREEGRGPTRAQDDTHACRICHNNFPTPGLLKRHERTHTGERPFSCGICKQKFTQFSDLKRHERTHTGERPFSCGICKQTFTQMSSLMRHGRTHTGERPFSCGICKQKFSQLSNLNKHERTHTGERPFSCGICKQKFNRESSLKRHARTHTGEKPFSCGICKQKFAWLHCLKRHARIHTREKTYSCGKCKQKFMKSANLKRHERTHTGENHTQATCVKSSLHD